MHCSVDTLTLEVAARPSPLSRAQVDEVYQALIQHHMYIRFDIQYISTVGDHDQKTSLRSLDRTDFFTKEIDAWVLEKPGRVGIHSAKDLPVPLSKGLAVFCVTKGVDPSDSLVLRPNENLQGLPSEACIATSSIRREQYVKRLRPDLRFCDIRGTIEQRLDKLYRGDVDGVVIAEAALIRLGLVHLNRIMLPGISAEGQGQLAVVGNSDDRKMMQIFSCLHFEALPSL